MYYAVGASELHKSHNSYRSQRMIRPHLKPLTQDIIVHERTQSIPIDVMAVSGQQQLQHPCTYPSLLSLATQVSTD